MKKGYTITLIIAIIVLALFTTSYFIFYNNKNTSTAEVTEYNEEDYNHDFSNYETVEVNLNEVDSIYKITKGGVYSFTGTLEGYIDINTSDYVKIILNNVTIKNSGPCIYNENSKALYIELNGENNLSDTSNYTSFDEEVNSTIYSKDDLIIEGDGTLNITSNYNDSIASKDDLVIKSGTYNITSTDDSIRGKDKVIILDGTFNIKAGGDGIKTTNDSDTSKGYILIKDGIFNIESTNDAFDAITNITIENGTFNLTTGGGSSIKSTSSNWGMWNQSNTTSTTQSAKGIKAGNNITINNINLTANTSDDAIHSNNNIDINNGTIEIKSGDDGIHADNAITINNGTINITQSYEGIEANNVTINDGNIKVYTTDDGININGGNDNSAENRKGANTYSKDNTNNSLTINGGTIYVNSSGDGLDSNGSITITGGYTTVDGPTDNGNGPLDYDGSLTITGGTLILAGSSGMMQNASSGTTQNTTLIYFTNTQNANTTVSVGNISYTPSKNYSCILISSPELETGKEYTVSIDNNTYTTFTQSNTVTTVGQGNSMGIMPGGNIPNNESPQEGSQRRR